MGNLHGKVAIVTGASRGMGAAIAKRLAAEGASVIVNYSGSEAQANEVAKSIDGRAISGPVGSRSTACNQGRSIPR